MARVDAVELLRQLGGAEAAELHDAFVAAGVSAVRDGGARLGQIAELYETTAALFKAAPPVAETHMLLGEWLGRALASEKPGALRRVEEEVAKVAQRLGNTAVLQLVERTAAAVNARRRELVKAKLLAAAPGGEQSLPAIGEAVLAYGLPALELAAEVETWGGPNALPIAVALQTAAPALSAAMAHAYVEGEAMRVAAMFERSLENAHRMREPRTVRSAVRYVVAEYDKVAAAVLKVLPPAAAGKKGPSSTSQSGSRYSAGLDEDLEELGFFARRVQLFVEPVELTHAGVVSRVVDYSLKAFVEHVRARPGDLNGFCYQQLCIDSFFLRFALPTLSSRVCCF